jgi:regulator of sigma E protease
MAAAVTVLEIIGKIILGLIGLGIVVFFHEMGHFLAARLVGIDVDAFCLGWGKTIWHHKWGKVEYRVALFPVGGYCKMHGEDDDNTGEHEKGSYYAASPWRRIIVCLAGPVFNILFAILLLSLVYGIGFEAATLENRIVLASDIDGNSSYPANAAGLKTGDWITAVNGKPCSNYQDVQEQIVINPEKRLNLSVRRDGKDLTLFITPNLDKSSGAGKIGVYFWTDPVLSEVSPDSPAARAGLQAGDRLISANGTSLPYTAELNKILAAKPALLELVYERNGQNFQTELKPSYDEKSGVNLGMGYQVLHYHTPHYSIFGAIAKGATETWSEFWISLRSLALLFKGINFTTAVSGPVRITYLLGDTATEGFSVSLGAGFLSIAEFLALISVALGLTNLLPLPILDGGSVVIFLIEGIVRRPLPRKALYAIQAVGVVLIFGIMAVALFGDVLFLVHQ